MSTKTDTTILETIQNNKYTEAKLQMLKASIKTTTSKIGVKKGEPDKLISHELIINNRVILGIEYAENGTVATIYTTDEKGKRVNMDKTPENSPKNIASKDLISARLEEASKSLSNASNYTSAVTKPEEKKVVRKVRKMPTAKINRNTRDA